MKASDNCSKTPVTSTSTQHKKTPGGIAPAGHQCETELPAYRSSDSTFCWLWLACAIIAVEAWLRIWALASAVVSDE